MDDIMKEIKTLLQKVPGIRFGFLNSASVVKEQGDGHGEIEIIVVGGPDLIEMNEAISEAEEKLRTPFLVTCFTVREFQERIKVKDEALLRVLRNPKVMLLGDEQEMKTALGAEV